MFSKNRPNDGETKPAESTESGSRAEEPRSTQPASAAPKPAPKAKPPASVLSSDLVITGNIRTSGDIQVEGQIEGDIHAHLLTVGETATIKGEIVADDIVVNGRVSGTVRGLKVRLTSSARVDGDIVHKTIAIESGAQFEGSVQRQEDPLGSKPAAPASRAAAPSAQD